MSRSPPRRACGSPPRSNGGVEAQTAALRDIARDFEGTANPEVAYLNEFETVMRDWVKRSLKKTERLVVSIWYGPVR